MGRLEHRADAARRSRARTAVVVVSAVIVLGLVAGGLVLATRSTGPTAPSPATSRRAVALGDSVPYGHGLHNPYPTPRVGLPAGWVSQGPSPAAYPSEVAHALGLTMTVRPTNCTLSGDQLSISGAVADPADNTTPDGQCLDPPQPARNLGEEVAAADLARHPARLVLLQDGADDIDFAACLEYALARAAGISLGLGTDCVDNGVVSPAVTAKLANVRHALARAIESVAPHADRVVVLDYYQPIPQPSQIADDTAASNLHTNLVCAGLKTNPASTYADAQVVAGALNQAVAAAVAEARADHVTNVTLVDIAATMDGHGMCTADPWIFSGEPVPDTTLAADAADIAAGATCDRVASVGIGCGSLGVRAAAAEQDLEDDVWRAAHPTAAGQQAIAAAVEHALRAGAGAKPVPGT
ncbi:MAG TPA: hypothetical protein VEG62_02040 [Acidimicrobiales bacterium]|nr:hypothetical protein [Acidimicrobiales bacterium]